MEEDREVDFYPREGRSSSSSTSHCVRRLNRHWASLLGLRAIPWNSCEPHRYFLSSDRYNDSVDPDLNSDDEEIEEISCIKKSLLEVKKVDFKEYSNAFLSHTDKYDLVSPPTGDKNLVIRRGEDFKFVVTFDRPYNEKEDVVSVIFETGKIPKDADGTRVVLPLKEGGKPQSWKLKIETVKENWVEVRVRVPATCCIGKWSFRISTVDKDKEKVALKEWIKTTPIYILFNPWCKEDTVYHPDEQFRKDHLLEDQGAVYTEKYTGGKEPHFTKWDFAQFDDPILKCVLLILEKNKPTLKTSAFSDPVKVVRKLTSVVNSLDNQGLLAGNWSGNYTDGTPPLSWNGSKKIMTEYYKTKSPVKYGQCWVFSAVLTTCLRALGILARNVTNSNSAHDTDGSLTIDRYFFRDKDGDHDGLKLDRNLTRDSIWNFHVWNDAWMARPDLDGKYREPDWQACDATPQETSNGFYSCGPCPVKAIKNGDVNVGYDGPFIFAEVNGDVIKWIYDEFKTKFVFSGLEKNRVGTALLTSRNMKLENVTEEYKFLDAENEKKVTLRASKFIPEARRQFDYTEKEELVLELTDIKEVMYGDPYEVVVKVTNRFFTNRTVFISIKTWSCYYTGIVARKIKTHYANEFLSPGESKTVKFPITFEEYEPAIVERCIFKTLMAAQEFVSYKKFIAEDDFTLSKPTIIAKANPSKAKVGQKVEVSISFVNSLPKTLTQCVLSVEGIGLQNPIEFNPGLVGPKKTFNWEMIIHPFKANDCGPRRLLFDFDSLEIVDIKGSCDIDVIE